MKKAQEFIYCIFLNIYIVTFFSCARFWPGQSVNIKTDQLGHYYDSNSQIDSVKYYWKKYIFWEKKNIDSANKYFKLLKKQYGRN